MGVTRLEFGVIVLVIAANAFALLFDIGEANRREALAKRAAIVAAINATPLFLGGRTNPLANLLGIPLSRYYLFHHWLGRIVAIKGLIHAVLSVIRFQEITPSPLGKRIEISSYLVSDLLILLLIFTSNLKLD